MQWVRKEIGPIASPDLIQFAPGLPKTRSGKIMRRILRKIAEDDFGNLGDTSTLADPAVVDDLVKNRHEQGEGHAQPHPSRRQPQATYLLNHLWMHKAIDTRIPGRGQPCTGFIPVASGPVPAHEFGHVKNRDTLTMTVTATIAGANSMPANFASSFGGGFPSPSGLSTVPRAGTTGLPRGPWG